MSQIHIVTEHQNSVLIRGQPNEGGAWGVITAQEDNESEAKSSTSDSTLKTAVSTTSVQKDPSSCGRCRKQLEATDQALECETCHQIFHIQCENVNKTQYNCIAASSKGKGKTKSRVHWYCNTCDIITDDWMRSMSTLHANQQVLEGKVDKLEEKIEKKADLEEMKQIENRVTTLEARISTIQENPENPQPSTSSGQGNQDDVIKEIKDQEERKKNVLFFNLPESKASDVNDRAKHDKEEVKEISKICQATIKKDEMIKAKRLGKKSNDKPRPLLIELVSDEKKRALFQNLSKLQHAPDKYKSVSVQNDLTPKQRENEKKLREEAKKKEVEASGEAKFKVRGPPWARRIIKIEAKKRNN